ncbi:NuA4 histone H4 acetyltransferase complex subunit [Reticulomyxa filosa]|uniref:NuA4 histone H4 acetyltransferase complex subunit n=1 Tax=Reticulomyxa filosa TaxID=46433 RepID=X6M8R6_RETFI|nr:NuA4 histone H4 acetyltransferase complex subunit [Reticulomyxa filosa]|eukprot:ETO09400.1 NuA4 histone H4 acetyltransferase complex subunit [Reticulomyxa filosa]
MFMSKVITECKSGFNITKIGKILRGSPKKIILLHDDYKIININLQVCLLKKAKQKTLRKKTSFNVLHDDECSALHHQFPHLEENVVMEILGHSDGDVKMAHAYLNLVMDCLNKEKLNESKFLEKYVERQKDWRLLKNRKRVFGEMQSENIDNNESNNERRTNGHQRMMMDVDMDDKKQHCDSAVCAQSKRRKLTHSLPTNDRKHFTSNLSLKDEPNESDRRLNKRIGKISPNFAKFFFCLYIKKHTIPFFFNFLHFSPNQKHQSFAHKKRNKKFEGIPLSKIFLFAKKKLTKVPRENGQRVIDVLRDYSSHSGNNNVCQEIERYLCECFDQTLEPKLLYDLEKPLHRLIVQSFPNLKMSQIYGVEHLCRFFVKLPQLLNPDQLPHSIRPFWEQEIKKIMEFCFTSINLFFLFPLLTKTREKLFGGVGCTHLKKKKGKLSKILTSIL